MTRLHNIHCPLPGDLEAMARTMAPTYPWGEGRVLELPVPVSKNVWQRQHWAARNRTKGAWHSMVWGLMNEAPRIVKAAGQATVHLVVFWDKPGPMPDHHNLDMAHECVADGLVRAGFLVDDDQGRYQRGLFTITRATRGLGGTVALVVLDHDWTP